MVLMDSSPGVETGSLPWITIRPLPTAPPSDHKSTDPQNQDLFFEGGFKGKTRALVFERIGPTPCPPSFMPVGRDQVSPSLRVQQVSMPAIQQAGELPTQIPAR